MIKIGENIILEINRDSSEAHITLVQDKEKEEIKEDLISYVDEIKKHIEYGLKESLLSDILYEKKPNKKKLIAEARLPIDGLDGKIKYNFDTNKILTPKIKPDGTVDYRELNSINGVEKGSIIAEIIPPKDGKVGINIRGEEIPYKKGRFPKFSYGKNVELSSDGNSIRSSVNGLVEWQNGKIVVSNLLEVESVDSSIGNIDFKGSVIINKDILNGYSVKATGDIDVRGAVEGGYIKNSGDVLIRQGIQGYNKLTIETCGNLGTKFIQNSIAVVKGNITSEAIMHSDICSHSKILVLGKKGLIVGGTCKASSEISARTVGSTMATPTILEIGDSSNSKSKLKNVELNIKKTKDKFKKIKTSLNMLETLNNSNKLEKNQIKLLNDLKKAERSLYLNLQKLEKEKKLINENLMKSSNGIIKVSDTIYPGSKIVIGNSFMFVKNEIKNCTFYKEGSDIRIGPY